MLTIGEILKRVRLEKKLTFEEIEIHLKIRKKFLMALEENSWEKLPSLPYIKGFLKNYRSFLGLKPNDMLDITSPKEGEIFSSERIMVTGITNTDAVILVNNQKIAVDDNGHFFTTLTLSPGTNIIMIESVSKYNRKNTIKRTIRIQGD